MPTRYSCGLISFGQPIFMGFLPGNVMARLCATPGGIALKSHWPKQAAVVKKAV
jgi:hypothetical protein